MLHPPALILGSWIKSTNLDTTMEATHKIGDRVIILHNILLGNLIGTVTAINYDTYEVTLDGGGKSNMYGFQLQPLP